MPAPTISLNDSQFNDDRYGTIANLRAENFYARTPEGHIIFLNQEDVKEVFRCENFRFTFNLIDNDKSPYLANAIEHELLNMHGPQHARLSRLLKRALRDRVIDGIQTTIHGIVDDLVNALPDEGEIDFCADFANPLPARVLGPMFGLPYDRVKGLNDSIRIGGRKLDALQSGVGIQEVENANRKIHQTLHTLLQTRKQEPGNDLFSELIVAEIDGDRMSEDELVYLAAELASAGVDTTRAQLPLILYSLLNNPAELQKLRDDPGLAEKAVDEGMRYAPLPWVIPHQATHSFNYKGINFKKGDLAFAMVPAANRDPVVMENPDTFNITRDRVRHFSFGYGMHVCPGLYLARMEMATALQKLVSSVDHMALAGEPDWEAGQTDRTFQSLKLFIRKQTR